MVSPPENVTFNLVWACEHCSTHKHQLPFRTQRSVFIVGKTTQPAAYGFVGLESINVTVNGQRFLVYHTDQCCWEAIGLLHNIDITASMGFEVTIQTGVANDTYYLAAFVGGA